MGIESLNSAAQAAGFAMATEDDVAEAITVPAADEIEPASSMALVPVTITPYQHGATLTQWLRTWLPSMGWRATA
jgi:hypothetical protein